MAGMRAYSNISQAGANSQAVQQNLQLAMAGESGAGAFGGGGMNLPGSNGSQGGDGSPGHAPRNRGGNYGDSTINPLGDATTCERVHTARTANQTVGYQGFVSCAQASDPVLPPFVSEPGFQNDFKKVTGGELADFMNNDSADEIPSQTLATLMGSSLPSTHSEKLGQVIAQMGEAVQREGGGAMYAQGGGGGRGRGPASKDDELDVNAMMQAMMGGLFPAEGAAGASMSGVRAVAFANAKRGPASVAEDSHLSLFDRVTYRYFFVGKQMIGAAGAKR
jgi:hypothetical protein